MGPRVVIVGASLAGLRSAEAVLAALPGARLTLIGDEPYPPYNRPPLSKDAAEALAAVPDAAPRPGAGHPATFARLTLRHRLADGSVDWRLGASAVAVDAGARTVLLADGGLVGYDWLIAATGLRPRRLPLAGAEARRHVLRSFDDALRLAAELRAGRRMLVVGAGFIGCEIAATAVRLGLSVRMVEPMAAPMLAALGPEVAAAVADLHRASGVDLCCGVSVTGFDGATVALSDGSQAEADVIVEALGAVPNVDWLAGTGAEIADGVLCDGRLMATGAERILAVGDVARFPNALFDVGPRRVEHWCVPGQTAKRAAETIAAHEAGAEPAARFAPLPGFWSDQHGLRLQSYGAPALGDDVRVLEGRLGAPGAVPCLVEYRRRGRPVGILGLAAPPAVLGQHRARLEAALNETVAA